MHIIGTAGHVDHGKSSLVISLTGHDPDRLQEERRRGMTLDLGFAPLRFPDGIEAGIIDVPGHEKFLHNMLAGAAGMELLLLVVSAVEGPMPQTSEHLQILNFLNVKSAIIVLTHCDLVAEEEQQIAATLVLDACRGTVAEGAPIVSVSNATGAGIERLRTAIHQALAVLPPRDAQAPAYLPIDRVFTLRGHGTVVTGTLMQGTIRAGERMLLAPAQSPARVRALQVFGDKSDSVSAGSRVAVNLSGLEATAVTRGDVLTAQDAFEPSNELHVRFTPLAQTRAKLRRRTPVRAHIGAAEVLGRLVLSQPPAHTDASLGAVLHLARPSTVYPGSRLVLRGITPKVLLGGAVVCGPADVLPIGVRSREKAGDEPDDDPCLTNVAAIVAAGALAPLSAAKIAASANVRLESAEHALQALIGSKRIVALAKPPQYISRAVFEDALQRVRTALQDNHSRFPWRAGMQSKHIAAVLCVEETFASRLLTVWEKEGSAAQRAGYWHLPGDDPVLDPAQRHFFGSVFSADSQTALLPASYAAIVAKAKALGVAAATEALDGSIAVGKLVRIGDDVYRTEQIDKARREIETVTARSGSATMSQLRDAFGTSRKYALPLLEYFDGIGLTVRDGDQRRLRKP
ncbi:MAG: selenocysteine-specific translation elongation factor [Candidatus Eremiobacteraeota bacterium]|nr:selenocysteine-specific translation elongation factor [Candidatus Eremiobacteraeota bacterium]